MFSVRGCSPQLHTVWWFIVLLCDNQVFLLLSFPPTSIKHLIVMPSPLNQCFSAFMECQQPKTLHRFIDLFFRHIQHSCCCLSGHDSVQRSVLAPGREAKLSWCWMYSCRLWLYISETCNEVQCTNKAIEPRLPLCIWRFQRDHYTWVSSSFILLFPFCLTELGRSHEWLHLRFFVLKNVPDLYSNCKSKMFKSDKSRWVLCDTTFEPSCLRRSLRLPSSLCWSVNSSPRAPGFNNSFNSSVCPSALSSSCSWTFNSEYFHCTYCTVSL